jgi:hypothetical protein
LSAPTFCREDTAVCRFPLSAVSDSQLVRSGDKARERETTTERERRKRCQASEARKLECDMQPAGHSHCWAAGHCLDRRVLMQFRSIFCPSARLPRRVSHRAQIKCGDGSGRCIRACLNCNGWDNVMRCALFSSSLPTGLCRTLQALHYSRDRIISFMSK